MTLQPAKVYLQAGFLTTEPDNIKNQPYPAQWKALCTAGFLCNPPSCAARPTLFTM